MSQEHAPTSHPHSGDVCPWWFCRAFDNPLRHLIHNPERILAGLVQPGQTALDLGCGLGYFSIPLARLVGAEGRVICVDLQEQMLAGVRRRAERAGVANRIRLHRAGPHGIGLAETADFALAFWMVHEVPDQAAFLAEVHGCLEPGGRLLIVEPRAHVGRAAFERSVKIACGVGFAPVARPDVALSRAAVLSSECAGG
jgi:ubiquinone/menaquinone biosynthesis C-methylase UbiE